MLVSFRNKVDHNSNRTGLNKKPALVFVGQLKQLKKDVITFKSNIGAPTTDTVYKKINEIADVYFNRLKESIQSGLSYLQEQIKNLQINFINLNSSAGVAKITGDPKQPGGIKYEMDINPNTNNVFDAVLHEGYHILQFENDSHADFVKRQKMLNRNETVNPELKEAYDKLTEIVVNQIVLPNFHKRRDVAIKDIIKAKNLGDLKLIDQIQNENIFTQQEKILPEYLTRWFEKLNDERMLHYVISHAEIEIKAHSYCKDKNDLPMIYNRNEINLSKVRDIIAIKIYQEIKELAQKEVLRREKAERVDLKFA